MKISAIETAVEQKLGSAYSTVANPDFPHIFCGPDLVIGGQGKLVAGFWLTAAAAAYQTHILYKLAISRLGLPAHMRTVLIADADATFPHWFSFHFHEVIEASRIEDLILYARSGETSSRVDTVPAKVQANAFRRGDLLSRLSSQLSTRSKGDRIPTRPDEREMASSDYSPAKIPSWAGQRPRLSQRMLVSESSAMAGTSGRPLKSAAIHQMAEYLVRFEHVLDNGVPYPKKLRPAVMYLDERAPPAPDPLKRVRAAAFAGWLVLDQRSDSSEVVERLEGLYAKAFNE
jgi:hypothetical protein